MEIRFLYQNELQWAVYTANEAFETCVRPYLNTPESVQQYYGYVTVENLCRQMSAGRLFLWGAFENGQMCAVSAIQDSGHITMLYVRPHCQRRHIGVQLLDFMSNYAASLLGKDRVTVNVMPVTAAPYFYHVGYTLIQGSSLDGTYVPLERRIWGVPQSSPGGWGHGVPQAHGSMPGQENRGYAVPQAHGSMPGQENRGYAVPQAHGNIQYGTMYMDPAESGPTAGKPEVKYTIKKVDAKLVIALTAGVLAFSFLVIAGITVYHM